MVKRRKQQQFCTWDKCSLSDIRLRSLKAFDSSKFEFKSSLKIKVIVSFLFLFRDYTYFEIKPDVPN
jgi:hypothetical protein